MHGLDVERLLAVPAVTAALVDEVVAVGRRGDLAELARLEQRLVVHLVVLLRVLENGRRGKRVGDRHGDAAAVNARAQQVRLAVRGLVLLRAVTAHRVGLVLAVRGRLVGCDLLAEVVRARLHPEPGARRRAGQRVGVRVQLRALVDAEDAADSVRHRGGRAGRERQRRRVRANRLAAVGVVAQRGREGLLDLGRRASRLDVHAARQRLAHLEALRREPVPHGRDVGGRRGVARLELLIRQPLSVVRAVRVGDLLQRGRRARLVTHLEHDAEVDAAVGRRRAERPGIGGPSRGAVGNRVRRG